MVAGEISHQVHFLQEVRKMQTVSLKDINPTVIEATNVRSESASKMYNLLSLYKEKTEGSQENPVTYKDLGEQVSAIVGDNKELSSYAESLFALFQSMKEAGRNNEPIRIIELTQEEKTKANGAKYGIIDGHNRYAVAQTLGFSTIMCDEAKNIFTGASEKEQRFDALRSYAIQGNNKTPMTMAENAEIAYTLSAKILLDADGNPIHMTGKNKDKLKTWPNTKIAEYMNVSESMVRKYLKYYAKLHPDANDTKNKEAAKQKRKAKKDLESVETFWKGYNGFLENLKDITSTVASTTDIDKRLNTIEKVQDDLAKLKTLLERAKGVPQLFDSGAKQIKGIQKAVVEELEKQTGTTNKDKPQKEDIKSIAETVEEA